MVKRKGKKYRITSASLCLKDIQRIAVELVNTFILTRMYSNIFKMTDRYIDK